MIDRTLRIGADWRDKTPAGERDVAHIRIEAGSHVLTRIVEVATGEVRDHVRASAVSLALWLTDNWWRLRWEPLSRPNYDWRLSHELSSAGSGYNWPPLMIYGAGARMVLAPAFGARLSSGPIRYLELDTVHVLPSEQFEAAVDRFIGQVIETCAYAKDGEVLRQLFEELREERAHEPTAAWRALEARLGFDPEEAPAELIEELGGMERVLGREGVEEAAAAAPGLGAARTLDSVVKASAASGLQISVDAANYVDPSRFDQREPAWRWGEEAAAILRDKLGVPTGVFHSDAFSELVGASWEKVQEAPATADRLPYSGLVREGSDCANLALKMKPPIHRRFELARMVGDAIWMQKEALGVVSRAKTERQKFQRGFAQALLCPFSEVRHYIDLEDPADHQIARAARELGVHKTVVETLLVNKNVLPRETLLDRLEAA